MITLITPTELKIGAITLSSNNLKIFPKQIIQDKIYYYTEFLKNITYSKTINAEKKTTIKKPKKIKK